MEIKNLVKFKLCTYTLAIIVIVFINSCAKFKIKDDVQYTEDVTSKFFNLPATTDAITKRVAAAMQKKMQQMSI
jgi:hypothetical protein